MKCLAKIDIAKKASRCLSIAAVIANNFKRAFRQTHSRRPANLSWQRDENGTTAVEFALIALPFLMTLLAVFEFGIEFVFQNALDEATTASSRQIRTGALQTSGAPSAYSIVSTICSKMKIANGGCTDRLSIDVRVFQSFSSVSTPNPFPSGKLDPTQLKFEMGGPGNIVLVTAYYQWTVLVPAMSPFMTPLKSGQVLLKSTVAFRNEPYG